jgi:hypothetical protein
MKGREEEEAAEEEETPTSSPLFGTPPTVNE